MGSEMCIRSRERSWKRRDHDKKALVNTFVVKVEPDRTKSVGGGVDGYPSIFIDGYPWLSMDIHAFFAPHEC